MSTLDFAGLVHSYCQAVRLPSPRLDSGVTCVIEPDGSPAVVLAWDEERDDVVIIVPLDTEAAELDRQEAHDILCAAFVGQNLRGAAVGIDPTTGVLSLWRRLASEAASLSRLTRDIRNTIEVAQELQR